jgi:photosystem II stability/assembly factor-like uncharacterized protein
VTIVPEPSAEWKQVQKQVLAEPLMPVAFRKVVVVGQNGWALTKTERQTFATTDGGKKWTRVMTGDLLDVTFADEMNGYALGAVGDVRRTTDGGKTWTDTGSAPREIKGIYALGASEVCVISGESFSCSIDGAQTWKMDGVSLGYIYHFHPGKTTRWLVGKQSMGKHPNKMTLWRQQAGTTGWEQAVVFPDRSGEPDSVSFVDDNTIWLTRHRVAMFTTDGAKTWKRLTGIEPSIVHFTDARTGFAIADRDLLETTDGGMTWTRTKRKDDKIELIWVGQAGGATWAAGTGGLYRRETP